MKIGIDWGGTKIEGIAIDPKNGTELNRIRVDSPKENYEEIFVKDKALKKELNANIKINIGNISYNGEIKFGMSNIVDGKLRIINHHSTTDETRVLIISDPVEIETVSMNGSHEGLRMMPWLRSMPSEGIIIIPMETSYDTICAADLIAPKKGYLEFDAQPPIIIP